MELFIPFAEKDLPVLPLAIAGARQHLFPAVSRVVGVGKKTGAAVALLDKCGVEFQDEDKVVPGLTLASMKRITYMHNGTPIDRTGWYFAQILKYGCARLAREQYFTVLDSDCVFVAPHPMVNDAGQYIFYTTNQYHTPYFIAYKALFGKAVVRNPSFISDHMIWDVDYLGEMLREIGENWVERILATCEDYSISTFSEFECYGNWLALNHPDQFVTKPFLHARAPHWSAKYHAVYAQRAVGIDAICYPNQIGFNAPNPSHGKDADEGASLTRDAPSFVAGDAEARRG